MKKKDPTAAQKIAEHLEYLKKQPKGTVYKETVDKQALLDKLFEPYKKCMMCPLATLGRNTVVFGEGNPDATLMFVGEGPGRDEDAQGRPFVGRAGKLLNKIIEAMNLKREQVYITNVVKCRPPGNRTPAPEESSTCKSLLLYHQIEIIQPQIICTLGACATQGILGPDIRIGRARGSFHEWRDRLVMPTYHPAYLLRNPAEKRKVWEDMQKIMGKLAETRT